MVKLVPHYLDHLIFYIFINEVITLNSIIALNVLHQSDMRKNLMTHLIKTIKLTDFRHKKHNKFILDISRAVYITSSHIPDDQSIVYLSKACTL